MIKKSTLLVLLAAIVLGGAVYYFDWKRSSTEKPVTDTSKPVFALQPSDVNSLTLSRPAHAGEPEVRFEKRGDDWTILAPVETAADQSSVRGIVDGIAGARVDKTESAAPDRLKVFGLDTPSVSLAFQTAGGAKHTLLLGDKDFSGTSVYALADGGKSVDLLSASLLSSADKSFDDLRDRSALHLVVGELSAFKLQNAAGEVNAVKDQDGWQFTQPAGARGDSETINALLAAISDARIVSIAGETPANLAKYGLASPAITFSATDNKSGVSTLLVGAKDGDAWYARDASRPTIFRIDSALHDKLKEDFSALRDKTVLHFHSDDINHVEIQDAKGTIVLDRTSADKWTISAPDSEKGKTASVWNVFSPIEGARAEEVFDHPSAAIAAKLAKPAVAIALTAKDGKKLTLSVSSADGDFAYAKTSEGPAVYKVKKTVLDDLNINPSEVVY